MSSMLLLSIRWEAFLKFIRSIRALARQCGWQQSGEVTLTMPFEHLAPLNHFTLNRKRKHENEKRTTSTTDERT